MVFARGLCVVIALCCLLTAQAVTKLELLGQTSLLKSNGSESAPGTEQVAYDDQEKVAYLISDTKLYVIDLSPEALLEGGAPATTPRELPVLRTVTLPTTATDVAFCGGYIAVSAEGSSKVLPGSVAIFSRYLRQQPSSSEGRSAGTGTGAARSPGGSLEQLTQLTVGALPDQLEFSRDCRTLLVSNEGEPQTCSPPSLANDPEGSVSVIKLHYCDTDNGTSEAQVSTGSGPPSPQSYYDCSQARVFGNVRTATFSAWNDKRQELLSQGVKLSGVGASVAQDLEPEYATFSQDEKLAFVALQENNAIAVLDVESATIRSIHALGFKDHSKPWNPLDPSETPLEARISSWPVYGMYQPDEMKSFRYQGADYLITANEGDSRVDWPGLNEETIVGNISSKLDPSVFQDINSLASNASLGRLTVLAVDEKPYQPYSDPNGSGKFSKLFSFGARSFAIWRLDQVPNGKDGSQPAGSTSLTLVFDSGAQLEQVSRDNLYDIYNSEGLNNTFDQRSAYKGPEPEGVAVGPCAGPADSRPEAPQGSEQQGTNSSPTNRLCLFLGTERLGVIFVYDITDPTRPALQSWARPPQPNLANDTTRLVAPEGLAYARYQLSATSAFPILLAAYEGSGEGAPAGLGVYRVVDA